MSDLSILVVGAGAVGGITASLLKIAGYNVEIAVRSQEHASLISEKGIEINGFCGIHKVTIPASSSISEVKEKKDLVLLATKTSDLVDATRSVLPVLKENGYLITMQNGICEEEISTIAGDRIIGCVTGWGATMESHGNLIMTSGGDFIIGYPDRDPDDFLEQVAKILSSVVPVKITSNIYGHKYSKLIINSCITSLGAICGMYLGKMLSNTKIRKIFIEIIREAVIVADQMHLKIEVFGGKLDFRKFIRKNDLFSDIRRHMLILIIGFKYRKLKSSSLQSLERGQQTEVDYLNGYIVKHAIKLGIAVPVNSAIVRIIHDIENGKRSITVSNFGEPEFAVYD